MCATMYNQAAALVALLQFRSRRGSQGVLRRLSAPAPGPPAAC
jgi:hypothetical protein